MIVNCCISWKRNTDSDLELLPIRGALTLIVNSCIIKRRNTDFHSSCCMMKQMMNNYNTKSLNLDWSIYPLYCKTRLFMLFDAIVLTL